MVTNRKPTKKIPSNKRSNNVKSPHIHSDSIGLVFRLFEKALNIQGTSANRLNKTSELLSEMTDKVSLFEDPLDPFEIENRLLNSQDVAEISIHLNFNEEWERLGASNDCESGWEYFLYFLSMIPMNYASHTKKAASLDEIKIKIISKASELADLLMQQEFEFTRLYKDEHGASPFDGMIFSQFISYRLYLILKRYDEIAEEGLEADNLAHEVLSLYKTEPTVFLSEVLKRYVKTLESAKLPLHSKVDLSIRHGKINLREYTKRVVFDLTSAFWQLRRAPNKEAAILTNIVLNLYGSEMVSANDISQMRKKQRRKYYK